MQGKQVSVKWCDTKMKEHEKLYDDYDTATKAYKWLIASGADGVDIAIVQHIKPSKPDESTEPSSLPYKDWAILRSA